MGSIEVGEGRREGFDGEVAFTGARAGGGAVLGERGAEKGKCVRGKEHGSATGSRARAR